MVSVASSTQTKHEKAAIKEEEQYVVIENDNKKTIGLLDDTKDNKEVNENNKEVNENNEEEQRVANDELRE